MKKIIDFRLNDRFRWLFLVLGIVLLPCIQLESHANVRLADIFGDHMVLQREIEIPVWGWADSGEKVRLTLNGQTLTVKADKEGKWKINLTPMKAGGPYEMVIQGKNKIILSDILIGDVWLCGGQSNMEMPMKGFPGEPIANSDRELRNANYKTIRLITVERNMSTEPVLNFESSGWKSAVGENIADFSAVGYFFGKEIFLNQNVPIGLISVNWGGTNCETWTSTEALYEDPDFGQVVLEMQRSGMSVDDYKDEYKVAENPSSRNFGPNSKPTLLYNGMLHPLIPFGVKGAIWYQGESNDSRAYQYRRLFPQMIEDWRENWEQGNFPFLFVQLAAHHPVNDYPIESEWAELREAQLMALSLANTGMAVTIDIGEANSIHPANKEEVGKRLALAARRIAYNQEIVYSGPMFKSVVSIDHEMKVSFSHTGSGLMIKDKYGYLKGFAIAGKDKKFYWAKARIEGNSVFVYHPAIKDPVAVRYAWSDNPEDANLFNVEGLPASPFRTDDWPGITKGKK